MDGQHRRRVQLMPLGPTGKQRFALSWLALTVLALLQLFCFSAMASPALELVCELNYANETRLVRRSATTDLYAGATVNLGDRFGFKAVVTGNDEAITHVTLSVYDLEVAQSPMLQQLRLRPPFNLSPQLPALTGWNHLYSAIHGREFIYGCALMPAQSGTSPG